MAYRSEFPPICVALGCADSDSLAKLAGCACESGEQFLELRLDMLDQPAGGVRVIRRLREKYPEVTLLATCRRKQNGGRFNGGVAEQLQLLEAAGGAGGQGVEGGGE